MNKLILRLSTGRRELVYAACMLGAALMAAALTTATGSSEQAVAGLDLEVLIPERFGSWRVEPEDVLYVNPATGAEVSDAYGQVLNRTYVDETFRRILLTVAYGGRQSDALRLHRPEVCYAAQGFVIEQSERATLDIQGTPLRVRRLLATSGVRFEPITYWTVVGGTVVEGRIERKLQQLRFALAGEIPDGLLIRVSSLNRDAEAAYKLQARFIRDLLTNMRPEARRRLLGPEK